MKSRHEKSEPESFWKSFAGILTATAAIITALGTLIAALSGTFKNSKDSAKALPPEASREFIIGHWRVEQTVGLVGSDGSIAEASGGSDVVYQADGSFIGSQFIDQPGRKIIVTGHWDLVKLSKDTFRLKIEFENQRTWKGTFQIVDQDRIHNMDHNYDAVRAK